LNQPPAIFYLKPQAERRIEEGKEPLSAFSKRVFSEFYDAAGRKEEIRIGHRISLTKEEQLSFACPFTGPRQDRKFTCFEAVPKS